MVADEHANALAVAVDMYGDVPSVCIEVGHGLGHVDGSVGGADVATRGTAGGKKQTVTAWS